MKQRLLFYFWASLEAEKRKRCPSLVKRIYYSWLEWTRHCWAHSSSTMGHSLQECCGCRWSSTGQVPGCEGAAPSVTLRLAATYWTLLPYYWRPHHIRNTIYRNVHQWRDWIKIIFRIHFQDVFKYFFWKWNALDFGESFFRTKMAVESHFRQDAIIE